MNNNKKLVIITGPSGVGKGTVLNELLKMNRKLWISISATTRNPRKGEIDGEHYYFLSRNKFKEMISEDLFIEWAQFADNYYGTPLKSVKEKIKDGFQVLLEIEVKGASQIKKKLPDSISIFILPPSKDELERRIRKRATDNEDSILKRLKRAEFEINSAQNFDYVVKNESVEKTAEMISEIIKIQN
tara:strand:+ start:3397 stop:3957 length:561 start_codon:yes stop_codon:yes gene_type:complete